MSRPRSARLAAASPPDAEGMERAFATLLLLSALTLGLLGLAGCNTLSGAGQDVSAAGHAVTDTAQQTRQSM